MVNQWQEKSLVKLHPKAKDLSFEYKYVIQNIFKKNIAGILGIDYFSLLMIDNSNILTCYSNTPALEFNLITSGLWMHDGLFALENHKNGDFVFWDDLYSHPLKNILKREKQTNFKIQFGFVLMKQTSDFFLIYSFATKTQQEKELYRQSKEILMKIGDYFLHEMTVWGASRSFSPRPSLLPKTSPFLKLVVDNTQCKTSSR